MSTEHWPAWLRNVDGALPVRAQQVLWGNVRDQYPLGDGAGLRLESLLDSIWHVLQARGYEFVAVYDLADGLRVHPDTPQTRAAVGEVLDTDLDDGGRAMSLQALGDLLRRCDGHVRRRVAIVVDYASRVAPDPEHLEAEQHEFFVRAEKLSHTATPVYVDDGGGALYNPVIWIVNREQDLPSWLLADNEAIRSTAVPLPDLGDRKRVAPLLLSAFVGYDDLDDSQRADLLATFANLTEGMKTLALQNIGMLAGDRGLPGTAVADAVRGYTIGLLDNPWRRGHLREQIKDGEAQLAQRVLGQPQAIRKSLDILQRSAMGLSGAQAASLGSRPRGVLFFAGPTGVGKTELAKALTTLVFGNEQAYLRFDMSEYSAEHAEARLVGAPPGYVGYAAGGQLTDAVRQRPFSLLLFDEVEKAAPRILDKFLQVLEDGRLTDGRGTTVPFSETLIVFTSNLGMSSIAVDDRPHMTYDALEQRVHDAIKVHFKETLNRPELLNRLGNNIVIFDFISPEVAARIFELQLDNVRARVQHEHDIALDVTVPAHDELRSLCTSDLSNGGRGIGNAVETTIINPLARALFEQTAPAQRKVTITGVAQDGGNYFLDLQ